MIERRAEKKPHYFLSVFLRIHEPTAAEITYTGPAHNWTLRQSSMDGEGLRGPCLSLGNYGLWMDVGEGETLWTHQIPKDSSTITAIQVALVKVSGSQNRKIYLQERDLWGRGGMKSLGREMKDGKGGSEQPRPHSHKQHSPDINLTSEQKARVETEEESSINH